MSAGPAGPSKDPAEPTRVAATPVSPAASVAPPRIGPYELAGLLGRGGMGVVYRARHAALGREVALKVFAAERAISAEDRARFRLEAELVARLRHPNIVGLVEAGEHEGRPFLAFELVGGESLAQRLAKGERLGTDAAVRLVATLARAVEVAHALGIVHRDLKPGNVLFELDGTPRVADFGLAKELGRDDALTQSGMVLGTPAYMSPEQALGASKANPIGPAADIYALGVMLYELVAGRLPFEAATPLALLDAIVGADPVPLAERAPGTPRDVATIAATCLAKSPTARYRSAAELADELERFLAGHRIEARPPGALARASRLAARHPAATTVLGTVVLALATLALVRHQHAGELEGALATAFAARARALDLAALADTRRAAELDQRERAERALAHARAAVDGLLARVAEVDLADVPAFADQRRAMLEEALAHCLALLGIADPTDDAARLDAARAHARVASIHLLLGASDRALEHLERGATVLAACGAEGSIGAAVRLERAECLRGQGVILRKRGEWEEARTRLEAALSALGAEPDPTDESVFVRAACLGDLANHHGLAGDVPRALELHRRALAVFEPLRDRRPNDVALLESLALTHSNIAAFLSQSGDAAGALAAYDLALGVRERLVRHDPTSARRAAWAQLLVGKASAIGLGSSADEARGLFARAREELEGLARDHPRVVGHRRRLAGLFYDLAHLEHGSGRGLEAASAIAKAIALGRQLALDAPQDIEAQGFVATAEELRASIALAARDLAAGRDAIELGLGLRKEIRRRAPADRDAAIDLASTAVRLLVHDRTWAKRAPEAEAIVEAWALVRGLPADEARPARLERLVRIALEVAAMAINRTDDTTAREAHARGHDWLARLRERAPHHRGVDELAMRAESIAGAIARRGGDRQGALAAARRAVALAEGALAASVEHARARALAWDHLASILRDQGDLAGALEAAARASAIARTATEAHPDLANVHVHLGTLRSQGGDPEGALSAWEWAIHTDPTCRYARIFRAYELARLLKPERALAEVGEIEQATDLTGEDLYNLACVRAVAAERMVQIALIKPIRPDPAWVRGAEREAWRIELEAIGLLRRAKGIGWLPAKELERLVEREADFERLRKHEKYAELWR